MPRTEATNQRIRDAQRARILEGASAVFARRGLTATMDEVAAAAGVSHGLAYRYFAGKDELFRALAEEALTRVPNGPHVQEMAGTPGERLHRLISTLLRTRREHPELFLLLNHVLGDRDTPGDLLELAQRRARQFRGTLRQLMVEGQATGEVARDDPDQLVAVVTACLDGLGRLALVQSASHFPDVEIVMRLLRAPAEQQS